MADRTNAEEHGHAPSETSVGAVLRALFAEQTRPADHHRQLRQPPAPHPADRRRRDRRRSRRRHARAEHEEERADGPRPRRARAFPMRPSSTSRTSTSTRRARCASISTGSQGEPMSALALLARGESKWVKIGETRHGDPVAATPYPATRATSTGSSTTCFAPASRSSTPASPTCTPPATRRPTS